jgi:hypothetical protein
MNDSFLRFVWQHLRFDQRNLCTQTGIPVHVISSGIPNEKAGPEFLDAVIRIGEDLRKGAVVVHCEGQAWYERQCDTDFDYSNVILNVCFRNVRPVYDPAGRAIPSLDLNGKIPEKLIRFYDQIRRSPSILACEEQMNDLDELTVFYLKDRLITESLEIRSGEIFQILEDFNWDWDKTICKLLVRHFGAGMASINFCKLADLLDYDLIMANRHSVSHVEALLFGQAGLLDRQFKDSYPGMLSALYGDFRMVYELETMDIGEWYYSGGETRSMVPLRLAKLAYLICNEQMAFHQFMDDAEPWKLEYHLHHSFYWDQHCSFDQHGGAGKIFRTKEIARLLLIKVFTPALYAYGKSMAVPDLCLDAIGMLCELDPETNRKTALFAAAGMPSRNASDSTCMNHLFDRYCSSNRCLSCPLSIQIMDSYPDEIQSPLAATYDHLYN